MLPTVHPRSNFKLTAYVMKEDDVCSREKVANFVTRHDLRSACYFIDTAIRCVAYSSAPYTRKKEGKINFIL